MDAKTRWRGNACIICLHDYKAVCPTNGLIQTDRYVGYTDYKAGAALLFLALPACYGVVNCLYSQPGRSLLFPILQPYVGTIVHWIFAVNLVIFDVWHYKTTK